MVKRKEVTYSWDEFQQLELDHIPLYSAWTGGPKEKVETSDRPATGHSSDGIQLSIDPELDVEE